MVYSIRYMVYVLKASLSSVVSSSFIRAGGVNFQNLREEKIPKTNYFNSFGN